jgi:hypothetical protein
MMDNTQHPFGGDMKNFLAVTEHPVERVLRVLIGVVVLSLVFIGPKTAWGWIGLLPVLTGMTGLCPLYTILGISTCPKKAGP